MEFNLKNYGFINFVFTTKIYQSQKEKENKILEYLEIIKNSFLLSNFEISNICQKNSFEYEIFMNYNLSFTDEKDIIQEKLLSNLVTLQLSLDCLIVKFCGDCFFPYNTTSLTAQYDVWRLNAPKFSRALSLVREKSNATIEYEESSNHYSRTVWNPFYFVPSIEYYFDQNVDNNFLTPSYLPVELLEEGEYTSEYSTWIIPNVLAYNFTFDKYLQQQTIPQRKPQPILDLEKKYNIELVEFEHDENVFLYGGPQRFYSLDENGKIVTLKIGYCPEIKSLDFLINFKFLKHLSLFNLKIRDLRPLCNLKNIEDIQIVNDKWLDTKIINQLIKIKKVIIVATSLEHSIIYSNYADYPIAQ